ncbi:unnamed protein product [Cyberlindnera jadinii]|uniref:Uncharacterized protein n=1 Tax=Cyberlindnera jadinii (strain ATCC 18201 / CBS 1600 / BCRC 20928 / JCM 3617 / NBRC 0987 / NRRL Y-1542) TaxID=983966 RepID=A0A0H5C2C4_CYBJN|nr:hypothetical protein CYBJADRAFT_161120 [Cyberlindnera jadinii NRRL Y-1542]ODV74612.1 hypothetical protein CYBJADRAFT_161120 [Cyberlindnera jadinii NRRL Y-1542]CEP21702.1 unnamed protein product [Cyberlindnera jadinii]
MSDQVERLVNHVESPLTRLRRLSPSVTHSYNSYPFVQETVEFILGFQLINQVSTFIAQTALKLYDDAIVKYAPGIYKVYYSVDEFILNSLIIGVVDKFLPFLKKVHLGDLTPGALLASLKAAIVSKYNELFASTKPAVVAAVNPILSPVNTTFESAIDTYLPKPVSTVDVATAEVTSPDEIDKLIKLTTTAYKRAVPIIDSKIENVKKYPVDLQIHVSKIYNSNLETNDKSIPRAVLGTSHELYNETLKSLGITEGKNTNSSTIAEVTSAVNEVTAPIVEQVSEAVESVSTAVDVHA